MSHIDEAERNLHFLFRGSELLVQEEEGRFSVPTGAAMGALAGRTERCLAAGELGGATCYALEVAEETEPPAGMTFAGLRALHGKLDPQSFRMAGRAIQLIEWDRSHQYCGRCGARNETKEDEHAKVCSACGLLQFPRLSPAVIVLVRRGDELLLGRSHRFPPGRYSVLAGFVEPGETLEEAVERELYEEAGIQVTNIRYFGSQPWPFPHSLMVGFVADYAGGEIRLQEEELADAGWYKVENLPDLPPAMSIARQLIDAWIAEQRIGR